jgi:hypothetical protein
MRCARSTKRVDRGLYDTRVILRCFYPADVARRFGEYRSRPPIDPSELYAASEVILGHFTSSKFLPTITRNGLVPDRDKERAIDDNLPSDDVSVYLSTTFQRFYMERAVKAHGGEAIVVEVKVPRTSLSADEEWLAPTELPITDPADALYKTMCGGSCKHLGPILLARILSMRTADGTILIGSDTE